MLTKRQKEVYDFILAYREGHYVSPSYREIIDGTCLRSTSEVNRVVCALAERGFVYHIPARARAIEPVLGQEAQKEARSFHRLVHRPLKHQRDA